MLETVTLDASTNLDELMVHKLINTIGTVGSFVNNTQFALLYSFSTTTVFFLSFFNAANRTIK